MLFTRVISLFLLMGLLITSCSKEEPADNGMNPPNEIPEDFKVFQNIFDDEGIGAGAWLAEDVLVIFDQTGKNYIWIENGVIMDKKGIDDPNSIFKNLQQNSVGAAVMSKTTLYLFAPSGQSYTVVGFDNNEVKGKWDQPDFFTPSDTFHFLREWGIDNSCPFGALSAAYSNHPENWCRNTVGEIENHQFAYHIDAFDTKVSQYDSGRTQFGAVKDLRFQTLIDCENQDHGSLGLSELVDAAFAYPVNDKVYEVFFYHDGKEFIYSEIGITEVSEAFRIVE